MLSLPFGLLTGKAAQLAKCVNIFANDSDPINSRAGFQVRRDGSIRRDNGGVIVTVSDYVTSGLPDAAVGDRYEIKVEKTSGGVLTADAGTGVWLTISSTLIWHFNDTPGQFRMWAGTYEIREIADPANIAGPCTVTINTEDGS